MYFGFLTIPQNFASQNPAPFTQGRRGPAGRARLPILDKNKVLINSDKDINSEELGILKRQSFNKIR